MKFTYFVLLVVTFPYWFAVVAPVFIGVGLLWMIGYPTACTAHQIYVRARYGKWVPWQLLYPGQ